MAYLVRMALLWLSLFTLPLHGMAGLTMPVCLPNGDMVLATTAMPAASVPPIAEAHSDQKASADDLSSKASAIQCGGNAACYVSVALPAARIDIPSATPASAPATSMPAPVIDFFTDGPDRPPRSSFV